MDKRVTGHSTHTERTFGRHCAQLDLDLLGAGTWELGAESCCWDQRRAVDRALGELGPFSRVYRAETGPGRVLTLCAGRRVEVDRGGESRDLEIVKKVKD